MSGVGLSVGAVARRLGIAPSTLRTWDRRYGIGPSRHSAGGHRRYDAVDVARLEHMNRLIRGGAPPEEAARNALHADVETLGKNPVPAQVAAPRGAGGNRLALPDASPEARVLARAAMAMDATAIQDVIWAALRRDGVDRTWQHLLVPVLIGIGERNARTGATIEVEHLLSGCVQSALSAVTTMAQPPLTTRPVLLACAAEEQHALAVHALGAALAERRVAVRVLGARVPYRALADAIGHLRPSAVFIWSQTPETGDPAPLADLPGTRPPLRLIVGGPGWLDGPIPADVTRVGTFPQAMEAIDAALGLN
ncbi:MerR family transcriptional regulator [Actinomadura flavalba]|uniref:MerR family transcriptional regulator n=1 Tax=Actinomadura flavalba TaxID=1120938 RepID=UPI0004765312|nr:MerR family transcriptional regulator [Actinomadura flavalba]